MLNNLVLVSLAIVACTSKRSMRIQSVPREVVSFLLTNTPQHFLINIYEYAYFTIQIIVLLPGTPPPRGGVQVQDLSGHSATFTVNQTDGNP